MIRLLFYALIVVVFLLLQSQLFPYLLPNFFKPELLLAFVVYLALSENFVRGSLLAWGTGLLLDSCGGQFFGLHGMIYLMIFLLARRAMQPLNTESPALLLIMVFCASLAQSVLLLLLGIFADIPGLFPLFAQRGLFQAGINVVASALLIMLAAQLQRRYASRLRIPGLAYLTDRPYGT